MRSKCRVPRPQMATLLLAAAMLLSACAPAAPEPAKPAETKPAAPAAPAQPAASPAAAPAASPAAAAGAAPAKPAAQEDLAALYEAAKKDGEFTIYTTLNTQFGKPLTDKFMAKYPGVKVNYVRQSSEKLSQVMQEEAKAGKMPWDVVEGNADDFYIYVQQKYVQPYTPSSAATMPANLKDPAGMWLVDRMNPMTLAINTNQVKPADAPKTWQDMTDPKWKGRFAVEEGNILLFTGMKETWGAEKTVQFWRQIAANQPQLRQGNTLISELLAAGEFAASMGVYANAAYKLETDGAPVKVIPADPVFIQLQLLALGAQSTKVNAAKLFMNWLAGDEGQNTYAEIGVYPSRPEVFPKAAKWLGNTPTYFIRPEIAPRVEADRTEFRQIMGLK